jgi:hypothetical protein
MWFQKITMQIISIDIIPRNLQKFDTGVGLDSRQMFKFKVANGQAADSPVSELNYLKSQSQPQNLGGPLQIVFGNVCQRALFEVRTACSILTAA